MNSKFSSRARRRVCAVVLLFAASAGPAAAASRQDRPSRSQFARAESLREALNGRPARQRTRRDYQRVINAYRRVYFGFPTSGKADPSVVAVAELLVEMGRQFDDSKILKSAIRQYEFLRREYPGSRYRFDALFTIAQIYKEDLDDPVHAKVVFQDFLKLYPSHRLAAQARGAVRELVIAERHASRNTHNEASAARSRQLPRVVAIRHWSTPDYTRVAVDLESEIKWTSRRVGRPDRIVFDLQDTRLASVLMGKSFDVGDGFLKKIYVAQTKPSQAQLVLEVDDLAKYSSFLLPNPYRLVIDIHGQQPSMAGLKSAPATESTDGEEEEASDTSASTDGSGAGDDGRLSVSKRVISDEPDSGDNRATVGSGDPDSSPGRAPRDAKAERVAREARPTSGGDRSLIRALGLKIGRIVIDPGHGGHDTGTIGPQGIREKDVVLDVALRLGKLLQARLGADVVYTREDDTFIPLETRTGIANREQADLFVSIHANSSDNPDARGVETYYLNFSSSADALEVAARENAVSEKSIHELQDLVKKIALKEKVAESREFAVDVQRALYSGLSTHVPAIHDRGVKKAPFVVLIGANMPSILAEISFVSNASDERRLRTTAWRQQIAESLYRGISRYVSGLSGINMASRGGKDAGQ